MLCSHAKIRVLGQTSAFEILNSLIKEDSVGGQCFAVGHEHIGEFWKTSDDLWHKSGEYSLRVSLEKVLKETGIPGARYSRYMALFEKTGVQRVSHCLEIGWSRFTIKASGLGVSGCLTSININDNLNIPKSDVTESYSNDVTPIVDGWYISHDCT